MQKDGFIVPPLSRGDIYASAAAIRTRLARVLGDEPYVPIDYIYELMPKILPGFSLEVCSPDEMGNEHGRTYPGKQLIQLRQDVYDGMCSGSGRDRFTGAHELGHLFLHSNVPLARRAVRDSKERVPAYLNSEWQADFFASAFLIDPRHLHPSMTVDQVAREFVVSRAAAEIRLRALKK